MKPGTRAWELVRTNKKQIGFCLYALVCAVWFCTMTTLVKHKYPFTSTSTWQYDRATDLREFLTDTLIFFVALLACLLTEKFIVLRAVLTVFTGVCVASATDKLYHYIDVTFDTSGVTTGDIVSLIITVLFTAYPLIKRYFVSKKGT